MDINLKCECGCDIFKIVKKEECYSCLDNGFYDEEKEEYIYIENPPAERTQCEDEGECQVGGNSNNGCHLYFCSKCFNIVEHVYTVDC